MSTSPKKSNRPQKDVKSSTANIALNIIIFFLAALIIYMSYSIFIKVTDKEKETVEIIDNEVPSDIIQCEVLNGCGVPGVADRFTDYLRSRNFDVVEIGNYMNFDVDETMVIDRIGNLANAKKVADFLGVKQDKVFQQLNDDYFLDVSIIIGKDYFQLKPLK